MGRSFLKGKKVARNLADIFANRLNAINTIPKNLRRLFDSRDAIQDNAASCKALMPTA